MSVDWSALRTPDFAGNALKFQAAGQEQQQVNAKQNALRTYATDPSAGISQLMAVDPVTATTLGKAHRQDQQDQARQSAAAKFAAGDVSGAQQGALALGDDDMLRAIGTMTEQQKAEAHQRADSLASVIVGLQKLPYEQRKQRLAEIAPSATTLGLTAEQVTNYDPTDANNQAMIGHVLGTKALLERGDKLSKPLEMDPSKRYYLPNDGSAPPDAGAPAATAAPPTATDGASPASAPSGGVDIERFRQAIRQQESGNTAGAVGPNTPYGNAEGVGQVLPTTAEPLARKIGLPWNPSMMRGTTPAALDYQTKISNAAIDEALQASGGDPAKAAAFYFAGPNMALHGPKTSRYVQDVMGRYQGAQPYEVAANGPTPPPPSIPGYHLIQAETPKAKDNARPATAAEKATYGIGADVPAQMMPNGELKVISGIGAGLKRVPAQIQSGYASNAKSITQIDEAIAAVKANPHALGFKNVLGDNINQRLDPDGVTTRAAVTNIGSQVLHDRSGAAVTAAESPRLMPFIPQPTDTADAAIKKLTALRHQYENTNSEIEVQFGEDSGYTPIHGQGATAPAPAAAHQQQPHQPAPHADHGGAQRLSPEEAAKLPPGTHFIGLDGVPRTRH